MPLYGLNKDVDPTALCIADYDDSFSQDWWENSATSIPNNGGGNPFTISDFVRGFVNTFSSSHEEFTVGSTNQPLGGDPFILTSGSLSSFYACSAAVSLEQSFQLSAINLEDTVFLNAPTGYELSKSAQGPYFNTIFYEGINGGISNTNVYVRLSNTALNGTSGNININSTNAAPVTVSTGFASVTNIPTANALQY